jgi:outer membrane protein OmpA-like peptidoglycan-associated protein
VLVLDEAAQILKITERESLRSGYTDSIGSEAYNLKLSDDANAVKAYLTTRLTPAGSTRSAKGRVTRLPTTPRTAKTTLKGGR